MGGQAFNAQYPEAKFPRMSPTIYAKMKDRLRLVVETMYENVAVPHEAPEKVDHGDVDFLVHRPRRELTHEDIKDTIGARYSIPANPTSHFAIPCDLFDTDDPDCYVQVDIHVCKDEDELQRVHILHSYGDFGIIVGWLASSVGLSLGTSGLKLANPVPTQPPNTQLYLTITISDALGFFGLSLDRWNQGFSTQVEVFDWVATSPYFNPAKLARTDSLNGTRKRAKDTRSMFQNFLDFTLERSMSEIEIHGAVKPVHLRQDVVKQALQAFGKDELYEVLNRIGDIKLKIKQVFSGTLVTQWTGVQGTPVRWIMDEVQRRLEQSPPIQLSIPDGLGSDGCNSIDPRLLTVPSWQVAVSDMTLDQVQELVVHVKEELDQQGKLSFDFRAAKKRKAERKALLESQSQAI